MRVKLSGDDLTSFIHNLDAVVAGMSHVPEEITLRDIFLRELRKSTKMKHDLETYERAKDGTKEHTYHWLIQSGLLNRETTHKNRQQIARAHGDKFGAPAPNIPDAPTHVVAEEGQALGKAEADQEHPQARDPQAQGRRGSVTTSNAGSAIGETNASTMVSSDRPLLLLSDDQAEVALDKAVACCLVRTSGADRASSEDQPETTGSAHRC